MNNFLSEQLDISIEKLQDKKQIGDVGNLTVSQNNAYQEKSYNKKEIGIDDLTIILSYLLGCAIGYAVHQSTNFFLVGSAFFMCMFYMYKNHNRMG